MKNNAITEYAEAIFTLSVEDKNMDGYFKDITLIRSILKKNPEYVALLASPNLTKDEMARAIDESFSPYVCENVLSFFKLFCERGHVGSFYDCYLDYEKLYNSAKRITVATVTSAVPLSDGERARLIAALQKRHGTRIELVCEVDPSILGGMIVRTEDTVADGSLISKLREIKDVIRS